MSNRLPILFLPGDTYANRMPDPVLQQVEHFSNPGTRELKIHPESKNTFQI